VTPDTDPLVLTLLLDDATQARFDDLRRRHFPPERNHLAAHVTVFHALPGDRVDEVLADLRAAAPTAPLGLVVSGVRSLGRGVAFELQGDDAVALRASLAARWRDWLPPQDRQRWRPHVTVQNKVDAATARALHADLARAFTPERAAGAGLALWRYRGGPWEPVAQVTFGPR
jgi:2'-5' RNA ligase